MVMFYFVFLLYRPSDHIMATIAQLKKTYSSFLLLWGKMTLTLLMLRYMLYKYFIVYFSLYSSIHHFSSLTLCTVSSFVLRKGTQNSILMVRSKNWWKRRTITLERQMQKEREDNWSSDTLWTNISHKTHI